MKSLYEKLKSYEQNIEFFKLLPANSEEEKKAFLEAFEEKYKPRNLVFPDVKNTIKRTKYLLSYYGCRTLEDIILKHYYRGRKQFLEVIKTHDPALLYGRILVSYLVHTVDKLKDIHKTLEENYNPNGFLKKITLPYAIKLYYHWRKTNTLPKIPEENIFKEGRLWKEETSLILQHCYDVVFEHFSDDADKRRSMAIETIHYIKRYRNHQSIHIFQFIYYLEKYYALTSHKIGDIFNITSPKYLLKKLKEELNKLFKTNN